MTYDYKQPLTQSHDELFIILIFNLLFQTSVIGKSLSGLMMHETERTVFIKYNTALSLPGLSE